MTHLILILATIGVQFAFWSAVAFIAGYTILAKWWRSEIGWARVSLDFAIALALSPTILHVFFGVRIDNSVAFAWYTIGAIVLVGVVSLWNLAIVIRAQLRHRRQNGGDTTYRNLRSP